MRRALPRSTQMEWVSRRRHDDHMERWLRLARDSGIAMVGVAALAGLARDLSATRGPVVAWIIVTLLGGAAGLFAWSLLEVRDAGRRSPLDRAALDAVDQFPPTSSLDPRVGVPMMPLGLFPPVVRPSSSLRGTRRHLRARLTPREQRMRTRRTSPACAATRGQRHVARATRRLPHANI
jgi:hypothetical protein